MATSRFPSEQYMSDAFVESAGAVLFHLSAGTVCVLRRRAHDEYVLAKGRRNCAESHQAAAVRETAEETGWSCRLLPLDMATRAPATAEAEAVADQARVFAGVCEPIALQLRRLGEADLKVIWWYVAAVNEDQPAGRDLLEREEVAVEFYSYADVLERLTFQMDRDVVRRAIDLVTETYGEWPHQTSPDV